MTETDPNASEAGSGDDSELAVVFRGRLETVKEVADALNRSGVPARVQNPAGANGNA